MSVRAGTATWPNPAGPKPDDAASRCPFVDDVVGKDDGSLAAQINRRPECKSACDRRRFGCTRFFRRRSSVEFRLIWPWPIRTPRGDMAVRRRRMQVRRRTAVALGVLTGVVEPPSDVTTLTRRPRIRPRSSTVRPTLVSPPSVNREAAAPYPFRPHDHTHTVSTMLNTAETATVHSLESTARALSPPPCRLLTHQFVPTTSLDATSFHLGIYCHIDAPVFNGTYGRSRVRHRDQTRR